MRRGIFGAILAIGLTLAVVSWGIAPKLRAYVAPIPKPVTSFVPKTDPEKFSKAAWDQIGVTINYDPGYTRIPYPNGDVAPETGVCTDVVIRGLRAIKIDLQKEIFEDCKANPSRYPRISSPDSNIDHRRCPNISAYLKSHAKSLGVSLDDPEDWKAGDIVFWKLIGGRDHVGVLSFNKNAAGFPLVIHNYGAGTCEQDNLETWILAARYRLPIRVD